jgi:hypothetical protein
MGNSCNSFDRGRWRGPGSANPVEAGAIYGLEKRRPIDFFMRAPMDDAGMATFAEFLGGCGRRFVLACTVVSSLSLLGSASRAEESAQSLAIEPDPAISDQPIPGENRAGDGNGSLRSRWQQIIAGVAEATRGAADAIDSLAPKLEPIPGLPKTIITAHQTCFAKGLDKPDCGSAARLVCSQAGYEMGKAIDVASGHRCRGSLPAASGTLSAAVEASVACKSKSWVTLAACW